jgi:hypothetical protein
MSLRIDTIRGSVVTTPDITTQEILAQKLFDFHDRDNLDPQALEELRDQLLTESDYVVVRALEQGGSVSTAWATYRQSLRDLTSHAKAPNKFLISDWPIAPGQSDPDLRASNLIVQLYDPVGLGTTSGVGVTTDTFLYYNIYD